MAEGVFCVTAAIVGAGFASGREIMQFFSRYGSLSWALIAFSGALTAALVYRLLGRETGPEGEKRAACRRALWLLLYGAVSGGMAAAAGELAALTLPLSHARTLGMALTLALCAKMSGGTLRGMAGLGKILLPAMAGVFILCGGHPADGAAPVSFSIRPFFHAAGYCGLNAALSAAVAAQAGKNKTDRERKIAAAASGLVFSALLALGNAALLPFAAALEDAALPMVALLRNYGKTGYYLSAAVLYLAVATTLIASLRGMAAALPGKRGALWAALIAAGAAMAGFEQIVARAYPILGYLCLLTLAFEGLLERKAGLPAE